MVGNASLPCSWLTVTLCWHPPAVLISPNVKKQPHLISSSLGRGTCWNGFVGTAGHSLWIDKSLFSCVFTGYGTELNRFAVKLPSVLMFQVSGPLKVSLMLVEKWVRQRSEVKTSFILSLCTFCSIGLLWAKTATCAVVYCSPSRLKQTTLFQRWTSSRPLKSSQCLVPEQCHVTIICKLSWQPSTYLMPCQLLNIWVYIL